MPLRVTPTLLNRIQLWVKFWEKEDKKAMLCTVVFEDRLDTLEIGLSVEDPPNAAVGLSSGAVEAWALSFEIVSCSFVKPRSSNITFIPLNWPACL